MITNFGSCCIDNVYAVPRFVVPGETLPCTDYQIHAGGKGLNQSIAIAYAGAQVRHAGRVGTDGIWMKDLLSAAGVDTTLLEVLDCPSGHANIQVTPEGENAIVIYGGANRTFSPADFEPALAGTRPRDFVLIQNEISSLPELIVAAHAREQRIVFNAAPFTKDVHDYPLDLIEVFIVNELEGAALTGEDGPQEILAGMAKRFPNAMTVLTLGQDGVMVFSKGDIFVQAAFPVIPVDTTGAGDTFTGYFLAGLAQEHPIAQCLITACKAASVSVTRNGAASSIPKRDEL